MIENLDTLVIPFRAEGRWLLGVALGFIVFAVALHLDRRDLAQLRRQPRAAALGLTGQWLLLPLLSVGLIALLSPPACFDTCFFVSYDYSWLEPSLQIEECRLLTYSPPQ